jgi:hypothetical protein
MGEVKYWRVRMKYGAHEELTREAWNRNEIGIWYGAWGASDLTSALRSRGPLKHLSRMNRRGGLKWDIPKHFLDVTKRFESIGYDDWVFVYFDNTLSLAKVSGGIRSNAKHPLNRSGEIFKYRKIKRKKSFSLDHLPDAFRLLRAAGRGNIFQLHGSRGLVELLGSARNESQVKALLARKELVELLELLGPSSWESVCQAYLTMEHNFVPTGLRYGGTLPDFDIIGRRSTDGARVLAQCKKHPHPTTVDEGFLEAVANLEKNKLVFYCAFGGCIGTVPRHVRVIDGNLITAWSRTRQGKRYFGWLRGE